MAKKGKKLSTSSTQRNARSAGVQKPKKMWTCPVCPRDEVPPMLDDKRTVKRHVNSKRHLSLLSPAERPERPPLMCPKCELPIDGWRTDSLKRHITEIHRAEEVPLEEGPVAGPSRRSPSPPVPDHSGPVFALEREVAPAPQVLQEPVVFPLPVLADDLVQGPELDVPAAPAWDPFALPEYDAEAAFTRHLLGEDGWDFGGW
ncbi:hypothetical protein B0H21DRAFT_889183 [Amylocystis lapponica]|nr:hypothetical protein B0H21DRAFT_889183 [Amylocystis lapponica]